MTTTVRQAGHRAAVLRPAPGLPWGQQLRRLASVAGWFAGLAAVLFWLARLGTTLPAPPADPLRWPGWTERLGAPVALLCLARVAAVAAVVYLLAISAIGLVARVAGHRGLVSRCDALSLPVVRRVLDGCVGLTFTVTTLGAALSPIATQIGWGTEAAASPAATQEGTGRQSSRVAIAPEPSGPDGVSAARGPLMRLDADTPRMTATLAQHTVQPGEHLWAIAEATVTEHLGRAPSESETARFWLRLIDANRDVLVDVGNPDLIFAGQQLTLPDPGLDASSG
ncbi:MAG: LysM peptidoglycan-binding domain-containing protein [Acidimicrobiia bacterium]|nr:LysM peptidoglycan-binding domain-containing protein [Acidimicrobiia bacterium]